MRRIGATAAVLGLLIVMPLASSAAQAGQQSQAKPEATVAALAPEALDRLLAPIALYPDQLLAQMLLCATNPAGVRDLHEWLKANAALKGTALQEAAQKQGFEPSFVALALFPQVVDLLAADLSWTTRLGQAFTSDRKGVLDSVQRLRAQSKDLGNLTTTPQQNVNTVTTESGQQVIVIEPANPQVVYVPQYNPQVIYAQPASTTVVVQDDDDNGAAVAAGVLGFAAGVAIGAAVDNDYYYGPYGWHGGPRMYNDDWDDWYDDREDAREDWYDNREDAREDWQDNREDLAGERGDRADTRQQQRTERAGTTQQERTERQQTRQEGRPETQQARQEARPEAQAQRDARRTEAQGTAQQARATGTSTYEARGHERERARPSSAERSGTRSDAFSGYSSGRSERSASARGQRSRSSGGGGRSRRR